MMNKSRAAGDNQKGSERTRRARSHFDKEFVDKNVPEWSDLIARVERG